MKSKRQVTRRGRRKGNAILESAFVFLTVSAMLIGTFDFGQFLFVHQALVERARSSARWGAVDMDHNTAEIENMVLYNTPDAPASDGGGEDPWSIDPEFNAGGGTNGDGSSSAGYFGLRPEDVTVSILGTDVSGNPTDDYRVEVKISGYQYVTLSPYMSGTYTGPDIVVEVPLGLFD